MRDLISASVAAMTRYSPASSNCISVMSSMYVHVLARDLGDRDVEDVEVLPADEVEQQVERAFERLEEHLERVRRNVEVARQLRDRLAFDDGERHLALRRPAARPR